MSSDREPGRRRAALSLAVLRGPDRGKILRTGRARVVIGSDPASDLSLTDPEVAPRHLRVELDGRDFRWEAGPERRDVRVDRSWIHPESGEPGGRIHLGASELLVFAGELSETIVQRELRATSAIEAVDPGAETDVGRRPAGLDDVLGAPSLDDKTVALVPERTQAIDALALAAMPTLAQPKAPPLLNDQATRILGRETSGGAGRLRPEPPLAPVEVEPAPTAPSGRNAWGDAPSAPVPPRNAWGDAAEPASSALVPRPEAPRSAWDKARVARPEREAAPSGSGSARRPAASGRRDEGERAAPQLEILPSTLLAGPRDPALEMLTSPDGPFASQVRLLGTRLGELFRGFGYRSFMVTSAEPLTGKTTVALNLALALAEDAHRRVALIETNFRFPRIGEILRLPPDRGLIGILEGRFDVLEASARWKDRSLVVFPAGGRHPQPTELLSAPRLKTLIRDLMRTVDVAILDAPSVEPGADANQVLALVDGALLVALDSSSTTRDTDRAIEKLGRERVFGGLYNHTPTALTRALRSERKLRA